MGGPRRIEIHRANIINRMFSIFTSITTVLHATRARTALARGAPPHPARPRDRLYPSSRAWPIRRAIRPAMWPPLNPASMFTTTTFEAQLLSIPSKAATPWKWAP